MARVTDGFRCVERLEGDLGDAEAARGTVERFAVVFSSQLASGSVELRYVEKVRGSMFCVALGPDDEPMAAVQAVAAACRAAERAFADWRTGGD